MEEQVITDRQLLVRSIVPFSIFFLCVFLSVIAWKNLRNQPKKDGVQKTLRSGYVTNERIFGYLYNPDKETKTYSRSKAVKNVRVNGSIGMKNAGDTADWRLQVVKKNGDTVSLTIDDVKKLPKTELTYNFKCIEGWSQITWWGGVKFSDLVKTYQLQEETGLKYLGLKTPDEEYYVGIDMPSALHSQTLLAYEMNGKTLPMKHGYPLRLIIPLKYGIKSLKRIGTMYFSNQPPPDYWAERGYDYYSGH